MNDLTNMRKFVAGFGIVAVLLLVGAVTHDSWAPMVEAVLGLNEARAASVSDAVYAEDFTAANNPCDSVDAVEAASGSGNATIPEKGAGGTFQAGSTVLIPGTVSMHWGITPIMPPNSTKNRVKGTKITIVSYSASEAKTFDPRMVTCYRAAKTDKPMASDFTNSVKLGSYYEPDERRRITPVVESIRGANVTISFPGASGLCILSDPWDLSRAYLVEF